MKQKLDQLESEVKTSEDVKKLEKLDFLIKKIIKQAPTIDEKVKSIQINFPFSQQRLQHLMGEIPKRKSELQELTK